MTNAEPVLTVRNLSKTFPGQRALREVSMDVLPGEIHALVGQNGSGKSTLIKCLSGYLEPDSGGQVLVDGVEASLPLSTEDAHRLGMSFIHQDLGLVPSLSVLENFCLGRGYSTGFGYNIKFGVEAKRVQALMEDFGHGEVSPWTLVRHLSAGDRTVVAIVRALEGTAERGRLLVLDEPTAALPEQEVTRLFDAIRRVAARGLGVMYVSHRLKEIFELADRVTVLRDAERVGTFPVAEMTESSLVEVIVGQKIDSYYPPVGERETEDVVLRAEGLSGEIVEEASFAVGRGEILGVGGLLGSGATELGRLLFGDKKCRAGKVWLKDKEVRYRHPAEAVSDGLAMITEDRRRDGCFPQMSVAANMTVANLRPFWKRGWLDRRRERAEVDSLVESFDIRPPNPERKFFTLSGGNQQKVILSKWLRLKPAVLICNEPVVGVDIGAKTDVYAYLERAASEGAAVLLVSSEFKDLANLCHRVLVMSRGHIVAELEKNELTEERITQSSYLEPDARSAGGNYK